METRNELSEIKDILDRLEEEEAMEEEVPEPLEDITPDLDESDNTDDTQDEDEAEEDASVESKEEVDYRAQAGRLQRELTRTRKKLERTQKRTKTKASNDSYVTRDELILRDLRQEFEPAVAEEIMLYAKGLDIDPIEASKKMHWKAQNEIIKRQRVTQGAMSISGTSRSSGAGKTLDWYIKNKEIPSRTDNPEMYRQWRHRNERNKPGRRRFSS